MPFERVSLLLIFMIGFKNQTSFSIKFAMIKLIFEAKSWYILDL